MEGDLSVGCGSSVGRCCCKLCCLLHVSCASPVGTADLWSAPFCLFFCSCSEQRGDGAGDGGGPQ